MKTTPKSKGEAFYLQQLVKMCPYPVRIADGEIDIPQDELETIDLAVAHLLSLGFRIQSCIPGSVTKSQVFDPALLLTTRVVERARNEFLVGDVFTVITSGETLTVTHIERGKIHLAYSAPVDVRLRQKAPLLVSEEQLKRVLMQETWRRV